MFTREMVESLRAVEQLQFGELSASKGNGLIYKMCTERFHAGCKLPGEYVPGASRLRGQRMVDSGLCSMRARQGDYRAGVICVGNLFLAVR